MLVAQTACRLGKDGVKCGERVDEISQVSSDHLIFTGLSRHYRTFDFVHTEPLWNQILYSRAAEKNS